MIIGNFKAFETTFAGTIKTLTFKVDAVFDTTDKKKSENSPDYRITNGDTEIGVAWKETSEGGKDYLSVQLDDPSLPAPIKCALVKTGIAHGYSLVWDRSRRK